MVTMSLFADVLGVIGALAIVAGITMMYVPAGVIAMGLVLVVVAVAIERGGRNA